VLTRLRQFDPKTNIRYLSCFTGFEKQPQISFSEEIVGLFDFLYVRRSFQGERHSNDIKKSDIKIFALVPSPFSMNIYHEFREDPY